MSLRKCILNETIQSKFDKIYFVWTGNVGMNLVNLKALVGKDFLHTYQTGDEFGFDQLLIDYCRHCKLYTCMVDTELLSIEFKDFTRLMTI